MSSCRFSSAPGRFVEGPARRPLELRRKPGCAEDSVLAAGPCSAGVSHPPFQLFSQETGMKKFGLLICYLGKYTHLSK